MRNDFNPKMPPQPPSLISEHGIPVGLARLPVIPYEGLNAHQYEGVSSDGRIVLAGDTSHRFHLWNGVDRVSFFRCGRIAVDAFKQARNLTLEFPL